MPRPKDKMDRLFTSDGSLSSQEFVLECKTCKEKKPLSEFYKDKYSRNGYRSSCKKCQIAQNSTPKALGRHRLYGRKRRKDIRVGLYERAKSRAKQNGIPFRITINDIYVPKLCPVFGTPLEVGVGNKHHTPNSPSLDRVNPELGYVPGNTVVISYRANRIKNDSTLEELEYLVKFIKSFQRVKLNTEPKIIVNVNLNRNRQV